jgi:hypothetical protein
MTALLEMTLIEKTGGALTKKISLNGGGEVKSDGSACIMMNGTATRLKLRDAGELAEHIERFKPRHALTLGGLRPDLPDSVTLCVKRRLNGEARPDLITRTVENFCYRPGYPALVLLDFDTKGMPPEIAYRMRRLGGFEAALLTVLPELAAVARLTRASTSAGLYRADTGEQLPSSGGLHEYLLIRDGVDAERFLKTLHARLWLAGFGWLMIGAGGQILERSIVDRVVASPERLVFEGPPILVPPLAQDAEARKPVAFEGIALDTIAGCPPLTIVEQSNYRAALARQKAALAPDVEKARVRFVAEQAERIATRQGVTATRARRVVERQLAGVLLPNVELPFDDPDLAGTTVAQVLADPDRFVGETLADPLEGIEYGRCKAKIMRRADGSLWIHSFAHGRTVYELKLDYEAVEKALTSASADAIPDLYVQLVMTADLTQAEIQRLRALASEGSGIGLRALEQMLKEARAGAARRAEHEKRERQMAERNDPRPHVPAPADDAEWLPQMQTLNEVIGTSKASIPPLRNPNRGCTEFRAITVPSLSQLSKEGVNQ